MSTILIASLKGLESDSISIISQGEAIHVTHPKLIRILSEVFDVPYKVVTWTWCHAT